MGAFVTASLITAVIEIPFSLSSSSNPSTTQLIISGLAEFLILLISQVLSAGVALVHLNMTRGLAFSFTNIFEPFKKSADRFFGAALLQCLLSVLACLPALLCMGISHFLLTDVSAISSIVEIVGWVLSLLLAVLISLTYPFVYFFLLDYPQMKVIAAFKECRLLMKKNKGRYFYLLLSFLGYWALIVCSMGLTAIWLCPYMTQTEVNFYLDRTGELDRIPVRDYKKKPSSHINLTI